jgi:hypothetical protein
MKTEKKLGIWMDHSTANLMEFTSDPIDVKPIESAFNHDPKADASGGSENEIHNKEQHNEAGYYKKLGTIIKEYNEVVLFGPTNAKVELFNLLKADHAYADIKFEIMPSDKMTDNQQHAFVREHFSRNQL